MEKKLIIIVKTRKTFYFQNIEKNPTARKKGKKQKFTNLRKKALKMNIWKLNGVSVDRVKDTEKELSAMREELERAQLKTEDADRETVGLKRELDSANEKIESLQKRITKVCNIFVWWYRLKSQVWHPVVEILSNKLSLHWKFSDESIFGAKFW